MTNLEVIKHYIGNNASLPDSRLRDAAELAGIDPEQVYVPANKCLIASLVVNEIRSDQRVKRISEGGYTVEYSDSVDSFLKNFALKSGCPDLVEEYNTQPKIRNASNRW